MAAVPSMRLLAVLAVLLAPPPASAATAECAVEFRSVPAPKRHRVTQRACDGKCHFTVQLCVNEPMPGREAAPITRLRVKPAAGIMAPPTPALGREHACGEPITITLAAKRARPAKRLLRVRASAGPGRRDRDRLVLQCLPNPGHEECTQVSTTTTTLPPSEPPPLGNVVCPDRPWGAPRLGRQADFPPSIPTPGTCAEEAAASNYAIPEEDLDPDAVEELHVVTVNGGVRPPGVFGGFTGQFQGVVRVHVGYRPKPVVLFLSAFDPVRWEIAADPAARLSRVIAHGSEQEVHGAPPGVPVILRGRTCGAYAYEWEVEHNGGGADYAALMDEVRQLVGFSETSFQGCSTGAAFEVPYWTGDPPTERPPPVTGDEDIAPEEVQFPGCEAVTAETAYCLTTANGTPSLLGLDTGRVCPVLGMTSPLPGLEVPLTHSIAWRGELMYACGQNGLVRFSLRDGRSETAQVSCNAAAAGGGRILLSQGDLLTAYAYDSYEAVLEGRVAATYELASWVSPIAVYDGHLLHAWHSADRIERTDLATGAATDHVLLEGYEGWILGMSGTPDGTLVVSGDMWGDTVYTFDAETGHRLCDVRPEVTVRGLSCVSRRESPRTCPVVTTTTIAPTTTTTTLLRECTEPTVTCCGGMPPSGRCWELLGETPIALDSLCIAYGGTLTPGRCPESCGAPRGCCLAGDCPLLGVFGDEPEGFVQGICRGFLGGDRFAAGRCNANAAAEN